LQYGQQYSIITKTDFTEYNTLIDFKIELGYDETGKVVAADEITPDIWRIKDENGNIPNQIDCAKMLLEKIG